MRFLSLVNYNIAATQNELVFFLSLLLFNFLLQAKSKYEQKKFKYKRKIDSMMKPTEKDTIRGRW